MGTNSFNCNQNLKPDENCSVKKTLDLLSGKWRIRILYELIRHDGLRFGELKKLIPEITNTMLTLSLRELEEYKLVTRTQYNEIPPRVEYTVTESGKALLPVFSELAKWGETYLK